MTEVVSTSNITTDIDSDITNQSEEIKIVDDGGVQTELEHKYVFWVTMRA